MSRLRALASRAQQSRAFHAWTRFSSNRGTVLAGGITYAAFFSLFPALAAGFSVFGLIVGGDPELQERVVEAVNDGFGTPIIKVAPGDPGVVLLSSLTDGASLTVAGLIAFAGVLFTGLGWLGAMREGIRVMFGRPPATGNFVATKLRDTAVLVTLGLVVLVSALSGVVVGAATDTVLGWVGWDGSTAGQIVLRVVSTVVLVAVDFAVFVVLYRMLAGVRLDHADLRDGALVAAVALNVLKFFAAFLLGRMTDNEFLAAFAVALGVLIWLNFIARITLLGAAWGAVTAIGRGHLELSAPTPQERALLEQGAGAARVAAATAPRPRPAYTPVVSPRSADRVSVAAGAILGAAGAVSLRVAANAVRAAAGAVRRK